MRQTAAHRPYVGTRTTVSSCGSRSVSQTSRGRTGFTLIEVVVAMAILLVVMVGVLSAISFAYNSSNDTEMRNTAKNVASYTLEYLRARTVTNDINNKTLYNLLNPSNIATGTYAWYTTTNLNGALPSMIDVGNLPLQSDGSPCNYTSTWVRTATGTPPGKKDGDTNPSDTTGTGGIVAGQQVIRFASKHAASPSQTYADQPLAFTSTLQGYVSVRDITAPASTLNPAPEDGNLARMLFSGSNTASGKYRTTLMDSASVPLPAWTELIVRYPGVYLSSPPYITSFTAGATPAYLAKVYTTDVNKVLKSNQEYNPYYTTDATKKAATQNYRGFRVLTQVVARSAVVSLDANGFRHVQYYDVTVTVLWMNGTKESSYGLVSQIVAY